MYVLIYGGLGNQMFQLAMGITMGEYYKITPRYININELIKNNRKWELENFNINFEELNTIQKLKFVIIYYLAKFLPDFIMLKLRIMSDKNVNLNEKIKSPKYIVGYWQNVSYISDSVKQIIMKLSNVSIEQLLPNNGNVNIAVHIRRGDYVTSTRSRKKHLVCDLNWYYSAIQYVRNILKKPTNLIVFSDDLAWVENNISRYENIYLMDIYRDDPSKLMSLMSKCDHFIISNSTFSWWAAYLNSSTEKIICAPKFWFNGVPTDEINICPKTWHLI